MLNYHGLLIILIGLTMGFANAQEIPEEFYVSSQLYDNNASNAELTLSVDKFIYSPGDRANVLGFVHDSSLGARVFIQIIDPIGNVRSEINVSVSREGIFKIQNDIPDNIDPGDYTILAKYGSNGVPVLLKVTIHVESNETFVVIPSGSHQSHSGVNYDPQLVTVEAGLPLVWINNDESVHTVVSGKVGFNNRMFIDDKFDSGTFGPGNSFSMILPEGEYNYFCKLHPWLTGFISVSPSTDPNYVPPKPETEIVEEPLIEDGYVVITTDKTVYSKNETITIIGNVELRESNLPVTIKIINPRQNIAVINQIVPNLDKAFNFTLLLVGPQLEKTGLYTISAQYGIKEHKAEISFMLTAFQNFPVHDDVLLEIWNERKDLQQSYPEVAQGNLDGLKAWASSYGWNDYDQLSIFAPAQETKSDFPVPDDVLLEIWNERKDLQQSYPEVAQGNLESLKAWASSYGWKDYDQLSILTPAQETKSDFPVPDDVLLEVVSKNETQDYMKPLLREELIPTLQILVVIIALGVGGFFFVRMRVLDKLQSAKKQKFSI